MRYPNFLRLLVFTLLMFGTIVHAQAQDVVQEPATTEPPTLTGSEPSQIINDRAQALTVLGSNFTADATIRLVGYGLLTTRLVNSSALSADLPPGIPQGIYQIDVVFANGQTLTAPNTLTVLNPAPTPAPPQPTLAPLPTQPPPTPAPGRPSLVIRDFANSAPIAQPGSPITLTFDVLNQGNRPAQGVAITIDTSGRFTPAAGQAAITLPTLAPGASITATLTVIAVADTPSGANVVPLVMTYTDFSGELYTSRSNIGVTVNARGEAAQLSIARYFSEPGQVVSGQDVKLTLLITNTGSKPAFQTLLRLTGENRALLAGPQGDSFPLGDILPGETRTLEVPLIVNTTTRVGPITQGLAFSYLQDNRAIESLATITLQVIQPASTMLLESFSVGDGPINPGDRFTLNATIHNASAEAAQAASVIFATVQTSTPPSSDSGDRDPSPSTERSSTPSNNFSPLNSGGTYLIGDIEANGTIVISQEFIVSPSLQSGVYSLPITVRYRKPDGSQVQENLTANIVVTMRPRLQITLRDPLPPSAMVGQPIPLAVRVVNLSSSALNLIRAEIAADNADITMGAETPLSFLNTNENLTIESELVPNQEGVITVNVRFVYLDDLNEERTVEMFYNTEAFAPPPIEEIPIDIEPTPPPEEEQTENLLDQLLLGFLGLGD